MAKTALPAGEQNETIAPSLLIGQIDSCPCLVEAANLVGLDQTMLFNFELRQHVRYDAFATVVDKVSST